MTKEEKSLLIPKIEDGIVIDHIPAGQGVTVLLTIRSHQSMEDAVVTLGLNYRSTKLGRKDMVKLQNCGMSEEVLEHISVISPGMTIKRISGFVVEHKYVLRPPEVISLARCRNPQCVSNHERHLRPRFHAVDPERTHYRCSYCERVFELGELELAV